MGGPPPPLTGRLRALLPKGNRDALRALVPPLTSSNMNALTAVDVAFGAIFIWAAKPPANSPRRLLTDRLRADAHAGGLGVRANATAWCMQAAPDASSLKVNIECAIAPPLPPPDESRVAVAPERLYALLAVDLELFTACFLAGLYVDTIWYGRPAAAAGATPTARQIGVCPDDQLQITAMDALRMVAYAPLCYLQWAAHHLRRVQPLVTSPEALEACRAAAEGLIEDYTGAPLAGSWSVGGHLGNVRRLWLPWLSGQLGHAGTRFDSVACVVSPWRDTGWTQPNEMCLAPSDEKLPGHVVAWIKLYGELLFAVSALYGGAVEPPLEAWLDQLRTTVLVTGAPKIKPRIALSADGRLCAEAFGARPTPVAATTATKAAALVAVHWGLAENPGWAAFDKAQVHAVLITIQGARMWATPDCSRPWTEAALGTLYSDASRAAIRRRTRGGRWTPSGCGPPRMSGPPSRRKSSSGPGRTRTPALRTSSPGTCCRRRPHRAPVRPGRGRRPGGPRGAGARRRAAARGGERRRGRALACLLGCFATFCHPAAARQAACALTSARVTALAGQDIPDELEARMLGGLPRGRPGHRGPGPRLRGALAGPGGRAGGPGTGPPRP